MNMTQQTPDAETIKAEIIGKYPAKVAKKRAKSMVVNDPESIPQVQANVRTVPGIITQRGCCYAGCKGVVLGPTRDIVNITHGPIGCGFYSWLTRRNQTNPGEVGPNGENFMMYCFSTDMQDENIVFVGGSRAHHYQDLFRELGMKSVAAGYEFAHRDGYEGRRVLPTIQADADSRNIEELHVEADPTAYNPRKSTDEMQTFATQGYEFNDYNGMMTEMEKGSLVIDDISHYEMEKLIETYHPAVFCAGIKEKYCVQKMGVPLKQLHSYDYGGPYAGFRGAINFYRDIDRMVNAKVWKLVRPPWKDSPQIVAEYATA